MNSLSMGPRAEKVLNHGFVRLIDVMGDDLSVVRAARVSYNAAWRTGEDADKDERLIHFLMEHGHTSPFEHVIFKFDIKLPLFVVRQWHRHRTWSYNEVSARYSPVVDEFYIPTPETVGAQSKVNKQGRDIRPEALTLEDRATLERQIYNLTQYCEQAVTLYQWLLDQGWARELARTVLPTGMYTQMFATVDLHNLLHFLEKRLDPGAQWEIRQYAQAIERMVAQIVPLCYKAWVDKHVKLAARR